MLELTPKGVVGAGRPVGLERPTSSSQNLLQTRLLAMGDVGRKEPLKKPTHGAVDVAALSASSTFKDGSLGIAGQGLVPPGAELLIKAGDTVHRVVADDKGHVDVTLAIPAGTVVELATRALSKDGERAERTLNPVVQAVVAGGAGLLGEGHLVPVSSLTQRAPSAVAVADDFAQRRSQPFTVGDFDRPRVVMPSIPPRPSSSSSFFGGTQTASPFFAPKPAGGGTPSTVPMYLRGRLGG